MSKYREFMQQHDKKPKWGRIKYGGTYECQQCSEIVFEAFHDRADQRLVWTCSEGHESSIFWNV
jgi:hypothetical protein